MSAGRLKLTLGPGLPYPPPGCWGVVGCSGGVVDISLLSSGRNEAWYVDDLELETVGIVKECRVVARDVRVHLRLTLDLDVLGLHPGGTLIDLRARSSLERKVVQPNAVAVVSPGIRRRFAQADRGAWTREVPERLAPLALDLADPVVAERPEQLRVEGQAPPDRRNDEIDVVNAGGAHRRFLVSARRAEFLGASITHRAADRPRIEATLEQSLSELAFTRHPQEEPGERDQSHDRAFEHHHGAGKALI